MTNWMYGSSLPPRMPVPDTVGTIGQVPYFSIDGYQPQWLNGITSIATTRGRRLQELAGRILSNAWLVWDIDEDEWFTDAPVLLDFDGMQIEINHQKFDDLSLTWNTVDPVRYATWSDGDDPDYTFHLRWRHDARPELTALRGQRLNAVELLEWAGSDMANGMVAPSFTFADGRVTIHNALDENGLEFGAPDPSYRIVPIV